MTSDKAGRRLVLNNLEPRWFSENQLDLCNGKILTFQYNFYYTPLYNTVSNCETKRGQIVLTFLILVNNDETNFLFHKSPDMLYTEEKILWEFLPWQQPCCQNTKSFWKLKKMNIVKSLVEGYSKINTATRFGPIELLLSYQFHHNLVK